MGVYGTIAYHCEVVRYLCAGNWPAEIILEGTVWFSLTVNLENKETEPLSILGQTQRLLFGFFLLF
jgi:hypothetical protein